MKSSKIVLGVVASPHCTGNTGTLVKEVLNGAGSKGYLTVLKCLGDMQIEPLTACESDKPYGVAGPEDDMGLMHQSIQKMDAFVFGTPIYFDHISARAKIFIDRLIYYGKENTRDLFPKNIPTVIVITYEWDRIEVYDSVIEWIKGRLENYFKMNVVATLKAENTVENPVVERGELLNKAFEIGRKL
jgi:multimeric flavodoxin WrbA